MQQLLLLVCLLGCLVRLLLLLWRPGRQGLLKPLLLLLLLRRGRRLLLRLLLLLQLA